MEREDFYVGFGPMPTRSDIIEALLHDPPEIRWRTVRQLFHIKKREDREQLIEILQPYLYNVEDYRIRYRIYLALQALHRPLNINNYTLVKGCGVYKKNESYLENDQNLKRLNFEEIWPIVDFHIHPKTPDLKFFSDMREAGVTHGVILATDTDPDDTERPEVREVLKHHFSKSPHSHRRSFESLLNHIRSSLYSFTHVTNQDVIDWIEDYPDKLIGFGSVNLSKDSEYVCKTLDMLESSGIRGIKLLPHSQFFDPAKCDHMVTLMEYCKKTRSIILSHSGCGPGPFEIPELCYNSQPKRWEPILKSNPEVPIVLAHFGSYSKEIPGIWLFDVFELGKKYRNLYVDIAAVDWLLDREEVVKEIRKTIGFDRVLFGTDYPLSMASGRSWSSLVSGIIANTRLSENEKRAVLGANAARLLSIG